MKPLLLLLVIAASVATGDAIQCYQCVSPHTQCNDPFDETGYGINKTTYLSDCACVKQVLSLSFASLTTRGCINPLEMMTDYNASSMSSSRLEITAIKTFSASFCYTDLCNGAETASFALSALIVIAVPFAVSIVQ